jgi:hypothetical protein
LTERLEESEHTQASNGAVPPAQGPPGLRDLADRIEELRQLFAEAPWAAPALRSSDSKPSNPMRDIGLEHEDEVRQLRVQVATMEHRLAQSEKGGDTKRRGRQGGSRSMWQRVTRRAGFR